MAELTFADDTAIYDYRVDVIVFEAEDGLRRVRCTIGAKPLQDHFGARGRSQQQLMAAFNRGRAQIHAAVARKYASLGGRVAELVLTSRDLAGGSVLELQLAKHMSQSVEPGR